MIIHLKPDAPTNGNGFHFAGRVNASSKDVYPVGPQDGDEEYRPAVVDETDVATFDTLPTGDDENESVAEATRRILLRFNAMQKLGAKICAGKLPSLIISGPPGIGKSHTLDIEIGKTKRMRHDGLEPLEDASNWYDHISGGCTAPGLYHALWNMRNGGILFIDDCDGIFYDEEARNLLKIATDSSKKRLLSWRKRASWLSLYQIESTFDFKGHLIFLTNIDFEKVVEKDNKDVEHFKALIDRARYLCLTIRTQRDFMIRLRQVAIEEKMLEKDHHLAPDQAAGLMDYIDANKHRFYNLSLRLVGQIAETIKDDPTHWQDEIESTKMRTQ